LPYNHSNLDSDEVLYYVEGNYKARRGIEQGSLSLHPQGIPHGPHPGTVEASIGATHTNELAVMCDTFAPLYPTKAALALDDMNYPKSWESGWTPAEREALAAAAAKNGHANSHANGHVASANGSAGKPTKKAGKNAGKKPAKAKAAAVKTASARTPARGASAKARGSGSVDTWN